MKIGEVIFIVHRPEMWTPLDWAGRPESMAASGGEGVVGGAVLSAEGARCRLLRRIKVWVRVLGVVLASRAVRRARWAQCRPYVCPSAIPVEGSPWCKCSAKGCGCDVLHALKADAKCPRGRWRA